MPLGSGGRYRFRKGTNVRLHFTKGGVVDEAKNIKTGATHTPAEFAKDQLVSMKNPNPRRRHASA